MSAVLAHGGLPTGVKPWQLVDLVKQVALLPNTAWRVSRTAVALLEYCIGSCRERDFLAGSICGVWEQPSTLAVKLGMSTKVLHNAEAELRSKGWIERTSTPHARRHGERRDGNIVSLAGISLAPLIDRYDEVVEIRDDQLLQQQGLADMRAEILQIRRSIRELSNAEINERAEIILPRGRTSRIDKLAKLEAIKADLEALLVLVDVPSGDPKSSHRTEEIVTPNIPKKDSSQNRSCLPQAQADYSGDGSMSLASAIRLASLDYQELLAAKGGSSWPNLIETSAAACSWLGISQQVWGEACHAMGRERAALCVLILDRNAHLPTGHRYYARSPRHCLAGMAQRDRKGAFNLIGLLHAASGFPPAESSHLSSQGLPGSSATIGAVTAKLVAGLHASGRGGRP